LPLNARQAEVLRWIADGCPDGRMAGYSYKTTAVALQNRRLVTISKRGGSWRAALTDTGSYYVQHDTYPLTPATGRKQTFVRRERISQSEQVARRRLDGAERSEVKPIPAAKVLSPTLQLIADLLTNGGELWVSQPDITKYEARVSAAVRYGKVPEGKQLVTKGHRWTSEYVIRLQDAPEWLRASLDPISVPSVLRRPHPVVAALQESKRLVGIDRSVAHRALLLVQGLAAEAQRRGYVVKESEHKRDAYGYERRETKDHFAVTIGRHGVGVQLRQEVDRVRHDRTPVEQAKAAGDDRFRIPKFDVMPSKRLSIRLSGEYEHRQSKWTDSSTRSLEELLPQILQEIELRADAAEAARLAAITEAEERRRQWQSAMDDATRDYVEAGRAKHLLQQAHDWRRARRVRDYLEAMQPVVDTIEDPDDAIAAKEWHQWAEEWAAFTDPLAKRLAMPVISEPKPDDLRPFLQGWSPYGPDRGLGW
jgi:hypothetical protein